MPLFFRPCKPPVHVKPAEMCSIVQPWWWTKSGKRLLKPLVGRNQMQALVVDASIKVSNLSQRCRCAAHICTYCVYRAQPGCLWNHGCLPVCWISSLDGFSMFFWRIDTLQIRLSISWPASVPCVRLQEQHERLESNRIQKGQRGRLCSKLDGKQFVGLQSERASHKEFTRHWQVYM